MMTKDLRIGNWYLSTKFQVPVKCEMGDFYEIYARADGSADYDVDEVFQPLPLTEEWLLKFGFEEKQINNGVIKQYFHNCTPPRYRNNYGLFFRFGEMRNEIYKMYWYASGHVNSNMHSFPCKYVHQLQNLYFALTGEELTAK